jgi:hypothetical protein
VPSLEAGVRQFTEWDNTDAGRTYPHCGRTLARRLQTSDIARRLMRGGELHQEEGASSGPDLIAIFRAFSSISLPFVSSIQAL